MWSRNFRIMMRGTSACQTLTSNGCFMNISRGKSRCLGQILLAACLTVLLSVAVTAQGTGASAEPVLMRQLHQALKLAQQGDAQGAMKLTLQLLEHNPRFAPALKLKGMLLEES